MDSIDYFLRVKKTDVYAICPFFEAFEGMAAIRQPRPEEGEFVALRLMVSPDFTGDLEKVLTSLEKRVWLEILTPCKTQVNPPPLHHGWRGGKRG